MLDFVQNDFALMLKDEGRLIDGFPDYRQIIKPVVQISAFLYYLQKDHWIIRIIRGEGGGYRSMRLAWLMLEGSVRKNVIDNPLNSDFHKFYISQSIYFVDRCKKI